MSVVIPAFNAEHFLTDCLESVLAQEGPRLQVILVDDGSVDRTRQVAQRYAHRVQYIFKPHGGRAAAARNAGARAATGALITFFDADDVMAPGKLQSQAEVLQEHPDLDCVVTNYHNFSAAGLYERSHFETCPRLQAVFAAAGGKDFISLAPREVRSLLIGENFGTACSPMFRAAPFFRLSGFNESLSASEDFELQYRFALHGALGILRRVGFQRRIHASNVSHMTVRILREGARSRSKLARLEPDPILRRRLELAARAYRFELMKELLRRKDVRTAARVLLASVANPAWRARVPKS